MFQSTPAHDGRHHTGPRLRQRRHRFNPRPHTTGDSGPCSPAWPPRFQSTPAHDGRQQLVWAENVVRKFQSTPAHDGRRKIMLLYDVYYYVSIHARTRRATAKRFRAAVTGYVSIHARTRRATQKAVSLPTASMFQSTPAHDGRQEACRSRCRSRSFNPRPHTTGDGSRVLFCPSRACFNPRPHTTGDARPLALTTAADVVSIHARTRRATKWQRLQSARKLFQSTPAHDGRLGIVHWHAANHLFQSTPAHDGRLRPGRREPRSSPVSIHARTRRATALRSMGYTAHRRFNPRPHTTGDMFASIGTWCGGGFNPRPHTTGDKETADYKIGVVGFNPRPHTTGDCGSLRLYPSRQRFQSTPAHDGRRFPGQTAKCLIQFQSTPAHDGRRRNSGGCIRCPGFNPRPHTTGDKEPTNTASN